MNKLIALSLVGIVCFIGQGFAGHAGDTDLDYDDIEGSISDEVKDYVSYLCFHNCQVNLNLCEDGNQDDIKDAFDDGCRDCYVRTCENEPEYHFLSCVLEAEESGECMEDCTSSCRSCVAGCIGHNLATYASNLIAERALGGKH